VDDVPREAACLGLDQAADLCLCSTLCLLIPFSLSLADDIVVLWVSRSMIGD
jgi:hypothetical protein